MEPPGEDAQNQQHAPSRLGEFTLLDEIGRGGMGVVYRARQDSLGRMVAVKVLPSFGGLDPDSLARFQREAEAAGRLSHPGIVPIFAVGEESGVHYFAMDLVEGPSLQDLIYGLRGHDPNDLDGSLAEETAVDQVYPGLRDHTVTPGHVNHRYAHSCAYLASQVTTALAAAHEGKVIHRDLKPSNILLHPKGRPVLVDFGLARDELTAGLTRTGDAVGTPSYMSPEQARGDQEVDARADVYGLGATLYELLTLRPPYDGAHPGEIMRRILDEEPIPVRELNSKVPVDLASIVHCCLEKEPDQRYPTMEALHEDLQAFLNGRPVEARLPARTERLRRWLRRHRRAATVYATSFAVVLFAAVAAGLISSGRTGQLGREALDQARAHLEACETNLMQEAYGRAKALLGEEKLRLARQQHLREVFEKHTESGTFALLRKILDSIPPAHRDTEYLELLAELRGVGVVRLNGVSQSSRPRIMYRSAADKGWADFPEDGVFPGGEYLVRVERPGLADVVRWVEVIRDQTVELEVPSLSMRQLPGGMVLAAGKASDDVFAMDRTEMSSAAYVDFLRRLDDELLDEMLPSRWSGPFPPDGPEYPVRGLSFRQARTLAALLDRHLPSEEEYRIGAYGGLTSLPYPWGSQFDPERVAAAPDRLKSPLPSDSLVRGASPLGVVHSLGNVAEILAADREGRMWLAGGHYLSEPQPEILKRLESLNDPDLARPYAGVRLARFLTSGDTEIASETFLRHSREALRDKSVAQLVYWTVNGAGSVSVEVRVHPSRRAADEIPDSIPGFLQLDRSDVLQRDLLPLAGLRGFRDAYLMELPLWNTRGQAVMHVLHLPAGCSVEDVSPPPDFSFRRAKEHHLVWESPRGPERVNRALVRFRRDGMLSPRWPASQPAEAIVDRFFRAAVRRDYQQLASILAADFLFEPYGWTRRELTSPGTLRAGLNEDTFSRWRLVDVTAVGSVVTAEVLVDWRPLDRGEQLNVVSDWLFLVYLQRTPGGYQVLRIEPAGKVDSGTIRDGAYHHEPLKIEVQAPEGVALVRGQEAPVAMQVTGLPVGGAAPPGVDFTVLGHTAARGGESDVRIAHLLSNGDLSVRPGELRTGPRQQLIPGAKGGTGAFGFNKEWLFWSLSGREFSRERWTTLEVGPRHFLFRARARATTRREAQRRFAAAEDWFESMIRALRIQ